MPLLAWSQDDLLAHRSGYHVLADYLDAPKVVTRRCDPSSPFPLFFTRMARRLAASRWYSGGSWQMERQIVKHSRAGFDGPVHLLWCDRDLGFLDLFLQQPIIGTFHQCPDDLPHIIRRPSALKKLAAIILMSDSQRPYFLHHGVSPHRLHRIPHGVDVDHFTPLAFEPGEAFNVLAVGGTRRDFPLMQSVANSLRDNPRFHFDIVGPPDKQALFAGMSNVRYHQGIDDAALLDLYRRSSCLLHLPENATANNVVLEALACGLPVISQRIGGIPEYLTPECASVTAPGDGEAVVKALASLAESQTRQMEMREAARAHALKFDWRITARATAEIYRTAA